MSPGNKEEVVLVDESDNPIGIAQKSEIHTDNTPLHRGVSVFLFNRKGEVLVQRRAEHKLTWPGVWSNSCCGHPLPGESYIDAARREVKEELGLDVKNLRKVSDYRYQFERNGVVENEICPVFTGKAVGDVKPDPREVADYKWMGWKGFKRALADDVDGSWSEWCKEEAELVESALE